MYTKRLSLFSMILLIPLLLGGILLSLLSSQPTLAAPNSTLTVTNLNDSGTGSLRQAISDAGDGDTIEFGLSGTIVLTSGELVISKSLTIDGGSAITVSGNNANRVFNVAAGNVTLDSLRIISGTTTNDGGGIYNSGTLAVSNSILSGNSAGRYGGGIRNNGILTVTHSTFSNNSAGRYGGGIYNESTFTANNGTLTVSNSTFSDNSAGIYGGGIYNYGTLTIAHSTFSNNAANNGGGIFNAGTFTPNNGILTVSNSTFSDNSAGRWGGGISNYGNLTLTHSTLSGNSAGVSAYGGGIDNYYGILTMSNTIIANSLNSKDCENSNILNDNGNNLVEDNSCGFTGGSDPLLAPLADNGGDTWTHALLAGSPAIDAGDCTSGPATDQRGAVRPQDTTCDIGAYEVNTQTAPNFIVNVNEDSDDGSCDDLTPGMFDCTLREAIDAANTQPGDDNITFAPAVSGTIVLSATLGDLDINSNLTIDGGSVITVSGNHATRVFIVAAGNVTLDSLSIISGTTTQHGGGIVNVGTLTVTNSTLSDNFATRNGGGIFNVGTLTVSNSTLSGNSAGYSGGGIYNDYVGTISVSNSTLSGNSAGNDGGGIYNYTDGTLSVSNSTLSSNSADNDGGGIYNFGGTLTVNNSTLSGNSADTGGGGIYNFGGTLTVSNTIIANSTRGGDCFNMGIINDNGNNLVGFSYYCGFPVSSDPLLAPLADNGGDTMTHALLPGSPAIDAGDCSSGPATDQRGVPRPIGPACDIGAFESDAYLLTIGVVGSGSVTSNPAQADYAYGTAVSVTATADAGWTFAGWSGDLSGAALTETVVITGNMAITATFSNDPPTADAGSDQFVNTNQTVTLDGSGSFDADPSQTLTYGWTQTGGTAVTLNDTTAVMPTFTAPATTDVLTFSLVVTDSLGMASAPDEVIITVEPHTIFLPILLNNYVSAPDLVVSDLVVTANDVTVILTNEGNAPVVDPFWVDVYLNPTTPPTAVNQTWQMLGSEGLVWGVEDTALPLLPGQSITLTLDDSYYQADQSVYSSPIASGTAVYAQVDSAQANVDYGAVLESHEITNGLYNNIFGPLLVP